MAITQSFTADAQASPLVGGGAGQAGPSTVAVQVTGTFTGTLTFQSTLDGTNFVTTQAMPVGSGTAATTATAAGLWRVNATALSGVRVLSSGWSVGTAVVTMQDANGALGTL